MNRQYFETELNKQNLKNRLSTLTQVFLSIFSTNVEVKFCLTHTTLKQHFGMSTKYNNVVMIELCLIICWHFQKNKTRSIYSRLLLILNDKYLSIAELKTKLQKSSSSFT